MCFNQVMIHEKFLYDRKTGEWTPEKYLQDLQDRFLIEKKQIEQEIVHQVWWDR